jgi:hypothetical protein
MATPLLAASSSTTSWLSAVAVRLVDAGRLRTTVFQGVTALVEKLVTIDKPVAGIWNVLGEGVLV